MRVVAGGDFGRFVVLLPLSEIFSGVQGGYESSSESKDSTRVDFKQKMKQIDLDGAPLWRGIMQKLH